MKPTRRISSFRPLLLAVLALALATLACTRELTTTEPTPTSNVQTMIAMTATVLFGEFETPRPTQALETQVPPTAPPSDTPAPTSTTQPSATSVATITPHPTETSTPTNTPTATSTTGGIVLPSAVRIRFENGGISRTVEGSLSASEAQPYVLRALAGQVMQVGVTSSGGRVNLSVQGASDGILYQSYTEGRSTWTGVLPRSQDYLLTAVASGGSATYDLAVTVYPLLDGDPDRVRFSTGGTSASIESKLTGLGDIEGYALRALANQTMHVELTSGAQSGITLIVKGANERLVGIGSGDRELEVKLPSSQDYIVLLANTTERTYTYVVKITIDPLR